MKFTIKTAQLQDLVSKAIKCSSNDKLLPMTSLMEIRLAERKLTLTTTDATNYFSVSVDVEDANEFTVVVMADSFAKLIARMTCENITFDLENDSFTVLGGKSKYNIELPLDVDGTLVKLTVPNTDDAEAISGESISPSKIDLILASAKPALATSLDSPCCTAYYVGDSVLATDSFKVCYIANKLVGKPVLISSSTMDLLDVMAKDSETFITYRRAENTLVFNTDNCILRTKAYDGIEQYPVDAILKFVDSEFSSECVVKKNEILQALDRLSVFVGDYDRNVITFSFENNSIVMRNKKNAGVETVDCVSGGNDEFTGSIDIEMFKSQIKANSSDDVRIQYGLDNCIKIIDGETIQIVALFVN